MARTSNVIDVVLLKSVSTLDHSLRFEIWSQIRLLHHLVVFDHSVVVRPYGS
jgi:hypothetical protein